LPDEVKGLARRHALDVRHGSFRSDMDKLVRALRTTAQEAERKAKEEAERIAALKQEAERVEVERKAKEEAERIAALKQEAERAEAERKAKEEAERTAAQKREAERAEAERKAAAAKEEAERTAAQKREAEKADAERKAREEAERTAVQRQEAERAAVERASLIIHILKSLPKRAIPIAAAVAAAVGIWAAATFVVLYKPNVPEEADRMAAEKAARAEADRIAAEKAARAEADRMAAENAAKAEADRIAAEKAAKADADRIAAEKAAEKTEAKPGAEFTDCANFCPAMIVVPAGKFTMGWGLLDSELGRYAADEEGPPHEVRIAKPFAVSKYEVTFAEWDACATAGACLRVTDEWGRGQMPVINVSWDDAKQYVGWLSRLTGKEYRLLTEAEWEYAARAGMPTPYFWGIDPGKGKANCDGCGSKWDGKQTAPVGSFKPNAFGLYDMAGNVFQWVEDVCYKGAPKDGSAWLQGGDAGVRVVRGSSWSSLPRGLRSANRDGITALNRGSGLGFRVGRTLTP
jgi:formylglycine-generating enzyme required for sulfatase activity